MIEWTAALDLMLSPACWSAADQGIGSCVQGTVAEEISAGLALASRDCTSCKVTVGDGSSEISGRRGIAHQDGVRVPCQYEFIVQFAVRSVLSHEHHEVRCDVAFLGAVHRPNSACCGPDSRQVMSDQ